MTEHDDLTEEQNREAGRQVPAVPDPQEVADAEFADEHFDRKVEEAKDMGAPAEAAQYEPPPGQSFHGTIKLQIEANSWARAQEVLNACVGEVMGSDDTFNVTSDLQEGRP